MKTYHDLLAVGEEEKDRMMFCLTAVKYRLYHEWLFRINSKIAEHLIKKSEKCSEKANKRIRTLQKLVELQEKSIGGDCE